MMTLQRAYEIWQMANPCKNCKENTCWYHTCEKHNKYFLLYPSCQTCNNFEKCSSKKDMDENEICNLMGGYTPRIK